MGHKLIWVDRSHCYRTRRSMRADQIRTAVLETTQQVLADVGPRAFTVKEVARRARVARTTIYKYFGLKAGLLAAARLDLEQRRSRNMKWSKASAWARVDRQRQEDREAGRKSPLKPPVEAIRQGVLCLAEHLTLETELFLLTAAESIRAKRPPAVQNELRTPFPLPYHYFGAVRGLIEQAREKGVLRTAPPTNIIAEWLASLWWHDLSIHGPRQDGAQFGRPGLATTLEQFLLLLGT